MKDQIAEIKNIDIPPVLYALFNTSNLEMFKHEFSTLNKDLRKQAIELWEKMLRNKKAVLKVMKELTNGLD